MKKHFKVCNVNFLFASIILLIGGVYVCSNAEAQSKEFTVTPPTGGPSIMDVWSNGKVGIGTDDTIPVSKLHINDSANANIALTNDGVESILEQNNSGGVLRLNRASDGLVNTQLQSYGNSFINAIIGNVGIGTASPGEQLHIVGRTFVNEEKTHTFESTLDNVDRRTHERLQAIDRTLGFSPGNTPKPDNRTAFILLENYSDVTELRHWVKLGTNGISNNLIFKDRTYLKIGTSEDKFAKEAESILFIDGYRDFIGINTVRPNSKLTIARGEEAPAHQLELHNKGSISEGNFDGIRFTTTNPNSHHIPTPLGSIRLIYHDSGYPDFAFFTRSGDLAESEKVRILNSGYIGIGTTSPQGKLDVNGAIYQRGRSLHADYVFESDYNLEPIKEHANFMWKNKHLKAIPKAKVDENGMEIVEVGSYRKGIVEELEKAHIYISQLEERLAKLEARISDL